MRIAFYIGGGSTIDKLISWWTADFKDKFNGEWKQVPSHVEISISEPIWYSASTRDGVFRQKKMVLNPKSWRIYKLTTISGEDTLMAYQAQLFIGMPYDWANIIGSDILKLNLGSKGRLTCDESVARIMLKSRYGANLKYINNLNPKRLEEYVKRLVR